MDQAWLLRVEKFIMPEPNSGCWLWLGTLNDGYGVAKYRGKNIPAHRGVYVVTKGPVKSGLILDHLCRTRCCVNPDHLEQVTFTENVRRGKRVGLTHCINGHLYDEANTYRHGGGRFCRKCNSIHVKAYKQRRKDKAS